jgi:membrane fusion protein, copper/silver efflux system
MTCAREEGLTMSFSKMTWMLVVCVAAASFLAGGWWSRKGGTPGVPSGGRRILYYHDPMHPAYRSDKPGIAPDCGMQLEPVYADDGTGASRAEGVSAPPGSIQVGAEQQQLIGVRVEAVAQAPIEHHVRILGRVAASDSRIYKVNAPADGLVENISDATVGSLVKQGETLLSFLSRELREQQGYAGLITSGSTLVLPAGQVPEPKSVTRNPTVQLAWESLRAFGFSEGQLQEISRTGKLPSAIRVVSPVDGVVLGRKIYAGERFERGAEFYRIADLRQVWVLADVFENEARLLDAAGRATVRYQGREYHAAAVRKLLPEFDSVTRVLKVRLEVDNASLALRPDMFVDVDFLVHMPPAITAPVDAVIDSGRRKTVFLDRGNGYFEARSVQTGVRLGDRVVVTEGLAAGDRIVVSGNFLIDSESRFQAAASLPAAAGLPAAAEKDPVCGMDVDSSTAKFKTEYHGKTHYFCSETCRRKFLAEPAKYSGGEKIARDRS